MDPKSRSGLEHINMTDADGHPVPHATGRRLKPDVSGLGKDLDGRSPPNPRKGLIHKLLDALKGKRVGR